MERIQCRSFSKEKGLFLEKESFVSDDYCFLEEDEPGKHALKIFVANLSGVFLRARAH